MNSLVSLLATAATHAPGRTAIIHKSATYLYADIWRDVQSVSAGFQALGLTAGDRVAIWLPKQIEMVVSLWACAHAGLVFIPVNPALKAAQVTHILTDSGARLLVTSTQRLAALDIAGAWLEGSKPEIVLTDGPQAAWPIISVTPAVEAVLRQPDDIAAILYTSGSTGKPKGVMLSDANLVLGSQSVVTYLDLVEADVLLCILPFSFDYGLNQLITSFQVGATAVLMDHLFAKDVIAAVERHSVTGLAAVPPLWMQLASIDLRNAAHSLRYITNSGGRMPAHLIRKIRTELPQTRIYLMYGLTEAFRSTYLDPDMVDDHPESVGQAIPFAEVRVVRPDGTETTDGEIGELVHAGPLVALGYWQDEKRTAERYRPAPACFSPAHAGSRAVFSGDQFRRDAQGLLYFVGRDDEMIKTSGYRVSPAEIEEALYATGDIAEAVATGLPDIQLGSAIVVAVVVQSGKPFDMTILYAKLRHALPAYMLPKHIDAWESLPRSANGKLDRVEISRSLHEKYGLPA